MRVGLVPALPGSPLMPVQKVDEVIIAETTVRQWQAARRECIRLCTAEAAESIASVVSCMQRNGRALLLLDRTFRLEVAWYLKVKEKAGVTILQARLLELLPHEQMHKTVSTVVVEIKAMEIGPLGVFLGAGGQGCCHALLEVLLNLEKGIALSTSPTDSQWLLDISHRFPNISDTK